MNVAIIGSRDFNDYQLLKQYVDNSGLKITAIYSGGARGADSLARQYAKEKNYKLVEFIPDWDGLGKKAGFIRNWKTIENADWVFAFWDKKSKGTKHSIDISRKLKKPLEIIYIS